MLSTPTIDTSNLTTIQTVFEECNNLEEPEEMAWKLTDSPFFADIDDIFANPIGFTIPRLSGPHCSPVETELRKKAISKLLNEIPKQP